MDKNGEIKCFYALCQCHYPPTSSHHLVRCPRNIQNNMLKVSAFSFVQRRNNSHKHVSLPKEKFPCRAGVTVSWLGPGVQDSSLKAGRWNIKKLCNATGQVLLNRLGLRRWIIFFFFSFALQNSVWCQAFYSCWFNMNLKLPLSFPRQYKICWHLPFTIYMNKFEGICVNL